MNVIRGARPVRRRRAGRDRRRLPGLALAARGRVLAGRPRRRGHPGRVRRSSRRSRPRADFGRVYAAYGGVFVIMSLLWGWAVDGHRPDNYDWLGAAVVAVGVAVIFFSPRH